MNELEKKQQSDVVALEKKDLGFAQSPETEGLIILPRAKMLQGSAEELKDENLPCRVGDIINSLTKEKLPSVFIPILFSTNWIRFNAKLPGDFGFDPAYEPSAIIWRANSKTDPAYIDAETKFGPNGEKPLATQFLNFFSYFPGHEMPIILSFAKTSFGAGRELFTLCSSLPGTPYAYKYKLGKKTKTGPSGDDYLVLTVTMAGKNEGEDYDRAHELALQFASKVDRMQAHDIEEVETEDAEEVPF